MQDNEIDAALKMIKASTDALIPEEKLFFNAYADDIRRRRDIVVPPKKSGRDEDAANFLEVAALVGLTLPFLGELAKEIIKAMGKKAGEKGAESIWDYLKTRSKPETEATKKAAGFELTIRLPAGTSVSEVLVKQDGDDVVHLTISTPSNAEPEEVAAAAAIQAEALRSHSEAPSAAAP